MAGVWPGEIADDCAVTEGCSPAIMLGTLAHLDARYSGAAPYLAGSGVDAGLAGGGARPPGQLRGTQPSGRRVPPSCHRVGRYQA